ncbi:ATPase V [Collimonas sp. H4R21]|uniref:ATPase V n=1 Tax=Collimonas rhizosphaerae TaxID=3126357 RepID=A0ABU9PYM1_9BURK
MHFTLLKSPTEALFVTATSRLIKADALRELHWAADLRESFLDELAQMRQQRDEAFDAARSDGYRAGERAAYSDLTERLSASHKFLTQAHATFEHTFARAVASVISQIVRRQPDAALIQAVIRQAYLALGRELMMRVVVHPEQRDATQEALKNLMLDAVPVLETDTRLARHACRIESQLAVVEHDLDAMLAGIERATLLALQDSVESTMVGNQETAS